MLDNVHIVMVNTTHSGNIGAAARAMKNMGLSKLVLVDPIAKIDEDALQRSSGALDILDNVKIVKTLAEGIADCGLVVGTSARSRHVPWPLQTPRQCAAKAREVIPAGNQVAVVFGRESRGLTNDELHQCNAHVHIPTDPQFSSLNIAAAIQLLCYEMRLALEPDAIPSNTTDVWGIEWDYPLATHEQIQGLMQHYEKVLLEIGFIKPHTGTQLMAKVARIYQRAGLDQSEVNLLRGILKATAKHSQGE